MPILQAKNLVKSYKGRAVLKDVSLSISSGEIVGLLGPNGAGKSTCFYMLLGIIPVDKGCVLLDNLNLTYEPLYIHGRQGIGYLPQEPSIFRKMTVENNILAILQTRKGLTRKRCHEIKESLLKEFNLTHIRKSMGMSLSGGERRRVEIARSLTMEPSFILLDEPFAGVDPLSVFNIKKIILHLKTKGIGILITDHDVRSALSICEKSYILNDGYIIAEGDADMIANDNKVKEVYLGKNFRF